MQLQLCFVLFSLFFLACAPRRSELTLGAECTSTAQCRAGLLCEDARCISHAESFTVRVHAYGVGEPLGVSVNGETITFDADGEQSASTRLPFGTPLTVSVVRGQGDKACTVFQAATLSDALAATVHCVDAVRPTYGAARGWNDYGERSDPTQVCRQDQLRPYQACLHLGEKRQVLIPGFACAQIQFKDSADAFDWGCTNEGSGARLKTLALKETRGLRELIDFEAVAFKRMSVEVKTPQGTLLTPATRWWENTVQMPALPASPIAAVMLTTHGSVNVVRASNATAAWIMQGQRIALVTEPGVRIQAPAAFVGTRSVDVSGARFAWIEVDVEGNGAPSLDGLAFSQLDTSVVSRASFSGLRKGIAGAGSHGSLYRGLRVTAATIGVDFGDDFRANTVRAMYVAGVISEGVLAGVNAIDNVFEHVSVFNAGTSGFAMLAPAGNEGAGNVLIGTVVAATGEDGLMMANAWWSTTLDTTAIGCAYSGLVTHDVSTRHENVLSLNHNDATIDAESALHQFVAAFSNGGVSGAGPRTGSVVVADDADAFGGDFFPAPSAPFAFTSYVRDPAGALFDRMRGYIGGLPLGYNGSGQNKCSGSCVAADFSLRTDAPLVLNANPSPQALGATHHFVPLTAADCAPFAGTRYVAASNSCDVTFASSAVERFADDIGNDNGLCEANEACVLSPNIGAYQGHGELVLIGAVDLAGFGQVTLYAYEHNGR